MNPKEVKLSWKQVPRIDKFEWNYTQLCSESYFGFHSLSLMSDFKKNNKTFNDQEYYWLPICDFTWALLLNY